MSFSHNRDTEDDLLIWEDVSFSCSQGFSTISDNISQTSIAYVCDFDYAFIVIPDAIKHVMVGPLKLIVDGVEGFIVNNKLQRTDHNMLGAKSGGTTKAILTGNPSRS